LSFGSLKQPLKQCFFAGAQATGAGQGSGAGQGAGAAQGAGAHERFLRQQALASLASIEPSSPAIARAKRCRRIGVFSTTRFTRRTSHKVRKPFRVEKGKSLPPRTSSKIREKTRKSKSFFNLGRFGKDKRLQNRCPWP
jgi:hypothetical protein